MKIELRRLAAVAGLTLAVPFFAAVAADAQTPAAVSTDTPAASDTAAPQTSTTTGNQPMDYGLFGLIGLVGLAGLLRRPSANTTYVAPPRV